MTSSQLCPLMLLVLSGVFLAATYKVKSVSVTKGDSVTLNTDVTEIQSFDYILWMFGPRDTHIAEIFRQNINKFDSNEIFGDRLKIDRQTGSLTITNITTELSGLYKLTIISKRLNSNQRFNVILYAPLPVPVISSYSTTCPSSSSSSVSRCSVLCSVLNVSAVSLSWYKGNSVLSSISVSDLSISLSLPLEVEYQDKNTYSCVINNTITNRTTHLDISEIYRTCSDSDQCCGFTDAVIRLVISAVVGVATVAAVIYDIISERSERQRIKNSRRRYIQI
ncbi:uncharacterized protein [Danio rerio]|uniref:Ig-like domain-containing protein n=1 Tax=Danio rerio TaxID=7955 RepID=A0A8M1PZY6_DANRE|nr:uncharacterized protein LOC100007948 [Danio rerio]|eukprot:XP_001346279.4 uncharacterized protein LOC100007948 [Danio rerio]